MDENDKIILRVNGWEIECESPFEIRHEASGSFATKLAAHEVLHHLKNDMEEASKQCDIERKKWSKQHCACPKCGSIELTQTLAGPIQIAGEPYEDNINNADCQKCEWKGKVKDLVPDEREYQIGEIKARYAVDCCKYYALELKKRLEKMKEDFEPIKLQAKQFMFTSMLVKQLEDILVNTLILRKFQIDFDETVWGYYIGEDDDAYENIIRFNIQGSWHNHCTYLMFEIDLRKPLSQEPKFIY